MAAPLLRWVAVSVMVAAAGMGGVLWHIHEVNLPYATAGYWRPQGAVWVPSAQFSSSEMLELQFNWESVGRIQVTQESYAVTEVGRDRPIVPRTSLGGSGPIPPGEWTGIEFPLAPYPHNLRLDRGTYVARLYLNGHQFMTERFRVTRPLWSYATLPRRT